MCLHFKTETARCRLLIDVPDVSLLITCSEPAINFKSVARDLRAFVYIVADIKSCAVPFVCLLNNCVDRNKQKNKDEKKKQERKKERNKVGIPKLSFAALKRLQLV